MASRSLRRNADVPYEDYEVVRLRSAVYDEGVTFPIGTLGTIVLRHGDGEAYEVEFDEPEPAVITLWPMDLEPA